MDGEWNYGYHATLSVRNISETGFIKVIVYLKCSEGEWVRIEEIPLCSYTARPRYFFFHEPTEKAVNVQCRAVVMP
jgi:hypothetical protein